MALSNTRGALLLTTGNKSELSVGYCTLYGDMSGGLAVIADVPKTMVYRVAQWRNDTAGRPVIPAATITKPPSAELRPNQTDQDSLPPYDVLDDILQRHVERHQTAEEIVAAGFDRDTVARVLRLVRLAEFKRKQAAPGLKVTDRAFGTGWRMPIAASQRMTRCSRRVHGSSRIVTPRRRRAPLTGTSPSRLRRPGHRRASGGASTATAPDDGARTSRARRCSAA